MIVMACGHAVCPEDFVRLGGRMVTATTITNKQTYKQTTTTRQSDQLNGSEVLEESRERRRQQYNDNDNASLSFNSAVVTYVDDDDDDDTGHYSAAMRRLIATTLTNMAAASIGNDGYYDDDDDEDDDDDYDYDSEDAREIELAEFWYNLRQYQQHNEVDLDAYSPPDYNDFPKFGQWMLIPDPFNGHFQPETEDRLYLVYYSQNAEDSLRIVQQFATGTRIIPNGKHGVYIHAPPLDDIYAQQWDVFYIKNDKPGTRRRLRTFEPRLKYRISKMASLVSDGRGGLWALYPENHLPSGMVQSTSTTTFTTSEEPGGAGGLSNRTGANVGDSNDHRHRRARSNRNGNSRDERKFKLVRYTAHQNQGHLVVGHRWFASPTRIFMEQGGGVFLLAKNDYLDSDHIAISSSNSIASNQTLWHVSNQNTMTLLRNDIPIGSKIFGDSNGQSVFILSPDGVNAAGSVLERISIDRETPIPNNTNSSNNTRQIQAKVCFSYFLNIPLNAIKSVTDCGVSLQHVYLHCRGAPDEGRHSSWQVCLICPQSVSTESITADLPSAASSSSSQNGQYSIVLISRDCPRSSQIVSDKENGIWAWDRLRSGRILDGDKSLLHLSISGEDRWHCPIVFPEGTHLCSWR